MQAVTLLCNLIMRQGNRPATKTNQENEIVRKSRLLSISVAAVALLIGNIASAGSALMDYSGPPAFAQYEPIKQTNTDALIAVTYAMRSADAVYDVGVYDGVASSGVGAVRVFSAATAHAGHANHDQCIDDQFTAIGPGSGGDRMEDRRLLFAVPKLE